MKLGLLSVFVCIAEVVFAEPSITGIASRQRYPWNGKVDISFTVNGDADVPYNVGFTAKDCGTNVTMKTVLNAAGSLMTSPEPLMPATYKWVWDAGADLPSDLVSDHVRLSFSIEGMPYSVRFNANGGSGVMARKEFKYGEVQRLTENAFVREGFYFTGWATNASGSVAYAGDHFVSNLTRTVNAVVDLYAVWTPAKYMVIDLSEGVSADRYPVGYLLNIPAGGWSDEYKTSKLVLRYIEPGDFIMGSEQMLDRNQAKRHKVSLTKGFWMGVFEMTQRQYELVMGDNPSFQKGNMRPVGQLCFGKVRGFSEGLSWPTNSAVDADSIIGVLRSKTKMNEFDLPTEAQWEYACRAGTPTDFNNGTEYAPVYSTNPKSTISSYDPNMDLLGRYNHNNGYYKDAVVDNKGGYSSHYTTVGSYQPNAWGLYDMHGNAEELVLDWYAVYDCPDVAIDPTGPSVPSDSNCYRSVRGGDAFCGAFSCRSPNRLFHPQTYLTGHDFEETGFRLCCHKELK